MSTSTPPAGGKKKAGDKKKMAIIAGGGVALILLLVVFMNRSSSTTATTSTDSSIDPTTGIPYADEVGGTAGSGDDGSDYSQGFEDAISYLQGAAGTGTGNASDTSQGNASGNSSTPPPAPNITYNTYNTPAPAAVTAPTSTVGNNAATTTGNASGGSASKTTAAALAASLKIKAPAGYQLYSTISSTKPTANAKGLGHGLWATPVEART